MNKEILYSVVIPIYNEEDNIPILYEKLVQVFEKIEGNYEIVFVDDGSSDSSWSLLKELHRKNSSVKILKFSRNFGHQTAISAGIDFAHGDAVITMDGDLQDPPELIPSLIEKWKEGYQVVYAVRKARKGESFFKKGVAWFFYRILKLLSEVEIPMDAGDYRLMDKNIAERLKNLKEQYRFIRGLTSWLGFKQTGVEFIREPRYKGEVKYSFWKLIKLALDGIISFSIKPLQVASFVGFIVSIFSFLYAVWAIIYRFALKEIVPGWASAIAIILFLGGIQLITLGIIGEYIGRIYGEVKDRPLYIIEEKYE
ncbi:MAG: glycosyltransferase family 2 protein [candidate division WOR-3 bacterium]